MMEHPLDQYYRDLFLKEKMKDKAAQSNNSRDNAQPKPGDNSKGNDAIPQKILDTSLN